MVYWAACAVALLFFAGAILDLFHPIRQLPSSVALVTTQQPCVEKKPWDCLPDYTGPPEYEQAGAVRSAVDGMGWPLAIFGVVVFLFGRAFKYVLSG